MAEAKQQPSESDKMILWSDSDPNVANQVNIIKDAGYKFKYFASTQELITFYKCNGSKQYICAIITSSLRTKPNGNKSGIEMINHLKMFTPSMKCHPVFAICSLSIKQHECTALISSCRVDIQRKVIAAIKPNQPSKRESCNAKGCNENHSSHHCKLCAQYNTDHRAMKCPKGKILYHGTKFAHFNSIMNLCDGSLFASEGGRLGKGVYFAKEQKHAAIIAEHWHGTGAYIVLTCNVYLGKMKNSGSTGDGAGNWREDYDSCFGAHCQWLSFKNGELKEYIIKDPHKFRITQVTLYNCHLDMDIFAPRLVINLCNATINRKRNITCGDIKTI